MIDGRHRPPLVFHGPALQRQRLRGWGPGPTWVLPMETRVKNRNHDGDRDCGGEESHLGNSRKSEAPPPLHPDVTVSVTKMTMTKSKTYISKKGYPLSPVRQPSKGDCWAFQFREVPLVGGGPVYVTSLSSADINLS